MEDKLPLVHYSITVRSEQDGNFKDLHRAVYSGQLYDHDDFTQEAYYLSKLERSTSRADWYELWHISRVEERKLEVLVLMEETMREFDKINSVLWDYNIDGTSDDESLEALDYHCFIGGYTSEELDKLDTVAIQKVVVFMAEMSCHHN